MKMNRSTRRNLRLQNLTSGVLFLVILILMAYATHRYATRWDWTGSGRNTLAEQSIKTVQQFEESLAVTVYAQENTDLRLQAQELLERYRDLHHDFVIQFVDPDLDPAAARQEEVALYGTTVFRSGNRREKITELTEEAVTNALIRLAKGGDKILRFITGHGEHAITGSHRSGYAKAVQLLKGEGYQIETLNLAEVESVPEGTAALILSGARKPLFPVEIERLERWMARETDETGGRLLAMIDPNTETGLESFFEERGVLLSSGIVIDPVARLFGGGPTTPLVSRYDTVHPITKNLTIASFLPETRALQITSESLNVTRTPLLFGAERGWLETGDLSIGEVAFDPEVDQKGPVTLGVAIEEQSEQSGKYRIVVVGDSDFASDRAIGFSANGDLFLNMVRWLAEDEDFIAIKPKAITDAGLILPRRSGLFLFVGLVFVIPIFLIATGVLLWLRRKRR